jgi:hypothetical protein
MFRTTHLAHQTLDGLGLGDVELDGLIAEAAKSVSAA